LVRRCETSDVPDLEAQLVKRRAEHNTLQRELDDLEKAGEDQRTEPTPEWIVEKFSDLRSVLKKCGPAAAHALRNLVGGTIVVREVRSPGKRHYLRGQLRIRLTAVAAAAKICAKPADAAADAVEEIVIDFRKPEHYELLAEKAKQLWDQG